MWRLWSLLQLDDPHLAADIFVAISRRVFIVTLVLAGVTVIFSSLAAIAANGPQCSGYELIERYRPRDFVGLVLWSGWMAFMVSRAAWPPEWARKQIEEIFAAGLASGVSIAYGTLLVVLVFSVLPIAIAVTEYQILLNNC